MNHECQCQVKDADPTKPCPKCGAAPNQPEPPPLPIEPRINTLKMMYRPRR